MKNRMFFVRRVLRPVLSTVKETMDAKKGSTELEFKAAKAHVWDWAIKELVSAANRQMILEMAYEKMFGGNAEMASMMCPTCPTLDDLFEGMQKMIMSRHWSLPQAVVDAAGSVATPLAIGKRKRGDRGA